MQTPLYSPRFSLRRAFSDPDDWRQQLALAVTRLEQLKAAIDLTEQEVEGVRLAARSGFPMSITPHYLSLCDPRDPDCPIRRQCIPRVEEAREVPGDMVDPLDEQGHEVAPGLIRRYPDRVLLLVSDRCAVYCRFCTRSRLVGKGRGERSASDLGRALDYIGRNPEIREVIVSGGEPLLMPSERLGAILERLAAVDNVLDVRVATRLVATLPQRITPALCRALRRHPATWLMTHFNHPRELGEPTRRALALLADSGIPLMSQTVLLRGVNDSAPVLEELFRALVRSRVRPYYLLQADPVRGTGHLRTPVSAGIAIMAALQGRLSGIALPRLMLDTPGGKGKAPVGPEYMVQYGREAGSGLGKAVLRTFRGELAEYIDPPEEG